MEQPPPILEQDGVALLLGQLLHGRAGDQDDRGRQPPVGLQVEFVLFDVTEEHVAVHDVAVPVRDLPEQRGQVAVLLDDALEDARRHQHDRRVRRL